MRPPNVNEAGIGLYRPFAGKRLEDERFEAIRAWFVARDNQWAYIEDLAAGVGRTVNQVRTTLAIYTSMIKRCYVRGLASPKGRKGCYCLKDLPTHPPPVVFTRALSEKGQPTVEASGAQSDNNGRRTYEVINQSGNKGSSGHHEPHAMAMDAELARQVGCKVAVHLVMGNLDKALEVINHHWQQTTRPKAAMTAAELLEMPVAEMGLSVIVINALEKEGLLFFEQLKNKLPQDLIRIDNFGPMSVNKVMAAIMLWREQYEEAVLVESGQTPLWLRK